MTKLGERLGRQMERVVDSRSRKASRVFPELVPQHELDRRSSAGLLKKWVNSYGYRKKRVRKPDEVPEAHDSREYTTTILSMKNVHRYGDLLVKYLQARREVFIVQKGWQLPETDGMEFDQYDTPLARWIVVHDQDVILGGARISPTTAECGNHSYMLRDAQLGQLKGLPFDMLYDEAPVRDDVWEATRLFVTDKVPGERSGVGAKCADERDGCGGAVGRRNACDRDRAGRVPALAQADRYGGDGGRSSDEDRRGPRSGRIDESLASEPT